LNRIRADWGAHAIADVKPGDIQNIKDVWQDQPAKANATLAVLSILFKFGMARGLCLSNPPANPGRLPPPKRTEVWSTEEEERVVAAFRPWLKLAFYLLLYTLQRPSDVLEMRRDRVTERDGRMFIGVKQAKTDALIDVPVHRNLASLLRARLDEDFGGPLLVPSPTGKPWSRRNFSRAWDHDLEIANDSLRETLLEQGYGPDAVETEIEARHRQRRDLRRTGIVRLAEAGATTPQIAAISGHAIDYCQRIIDTYLPRRTEIAVGGIETWENGRSARVAYIEFRKPIGNRETKKVETSR
jgi:integrase